MSEITPDRLGERLQTDTEELLVVDIRNEADFEDWHIPGSVNVDVYDELADNPESAKDELSNLPGDKQIVTVCAAGVLSQTATDVLQESGYDAATLTDGMNGWSRVHRHARVPTDLEG